MADELSQSSSSDPNRLNTVQALLMKFLFAFVLVFCIFVYLDKTSSLNDRSPEENRRLNRPDAKEEEGDQDEGNKGQAGEGKEGKTSALGKATTVKSRKVWARMGVSL